ncbi:MAG: TIGR03000 domain-containing protein [Planctomycetia bacterium]|nr:TIGR03000 domain-containing protein [Planctomycetia bacterium]
MYSLVLMATLSTPATTIDCHKRSCYGGCQGSSYASCTGGCYGSRGCYGSSCYGSCQGSCSGYSSCYGSTCYGSSCYGSSCSGSCHGSYYYYTGSCTGGHSCYGCSGSSCGGAVHSSSYTPSYETPAQPEKKPDAAAPAKVSISLPADAKLYVDGQLTRTIDKSIRTFMTPDLDNGQEYRYVMKAEVIRDGVVQSETKTVLVKAGADIREEFSSLNDIRTASNR